MTDRLPKTPQEMGAQASVQFYAAAMGTSKVVAEGVLNIPTSEGGYRGIPTANVSIESLYATVTALREVVETLVGTRGDVKFSAVKVGDVEVLLQQLFDAIDAKKQDKP